MFSTLLNAYPSVSPSQGTYELNNKQTKFPPIMSDGRSLIASWQPGTIVNDDILKKEGIQSNWQYRQFLSSNADHIRQTLFDDAMQDVGYTIRNVQPDINQIFKCPNVYGSFQDPIQPKHVVNNSDLKNIYLTREQLQSRHTIPTLPKIA